MEGEEAIESSSADILARLEANALISGNGLADGDIIVYIPRDCQNLVECSGMVGVAPVGIGLLHSDVAVGGHGFMVLPIHLERSRTMLAFASRYVII